MGKFPIDGEEVRRRRDEQGLTGEALAEKTRRHAGCNRDEKLHPVSLRRLVQIENGTEDVSLPMAKCIAAVLRVPLETLRRHSNLPAADAPGDDVVVGKVTLSPVVPGANHVSPDQLQGITETREANATPDRPTFNKAILLSIAVGVVLIAIIVSLWMSVTPARLPSKHEIDQMLGRATWIAYDPPDLDVHVSPPNLPTLEQVTEDLQALNRESVFSGIITFGCDHEPLKQTPRIAREVGFSSVIMGIYVDDRNPRRPDADIENAVALAPYVDAYCIGHLTPRKVRLTDLEGWMEQLRRRTGRPVTTCFPVNAYIGEPGRPVRELGDFLFPDAHPNWRDGISPQAAVKQLREDVAQLAMCSGDKPVLLKMISFPAGGASGLSESTQFEFYNSLFRLDLPLPRGFHFSFFSAFDSKAKAMRTDGQWARPEAFVGLFRSDRSPRPALKAFPKVEIPQIGTN